MEIRTGSMVYFWRRTLTSSMNTHERGVLTKWVTGGYWVNIDAAIKEWVHSCQICQKSWPSPPEHQCNSGSLPTPPGPGYTSTLWDPSTSSCHQIPIPSAWKLSQFFPWCPKLLSGSYRELPPLTACQTWSCPTMGHPSLQWKSGSS